MYSIPPSETLVLTKTCAHCKNEFPITDKDLDFYDKVSPIFAGVKCSIPTPTLCPNCRQQRRFSWRNERKLYKRKCDATGKDIVSLYSPDKPYTVYHQDFWWGDKWDPMSYGRDFDLTRPFFEQFAELMHDVPRMGLFCKNSENSEYTNHADGLKDCYFTLNAGGCANSMYGNWLANVNDTLDSSFLWWAENSYEIIASFNVYGSQYCLSCQDISHCYYVFDCVGCSDCFLCSNLRNRKYCFKNVEYSEAEYRKKVSGYYSAGDARSTAYADWKKMIDANGLSNHRIVASQNSSGYDIIRSDNVHRSFWILDSQNIRYSQNSLGIDTGYDITESGFETSFLYECHSCNRGNMVRFWHISYDNSRSLYIDSCHNASDLFGCIGLRNKQYCILNKQYTRSEYEELVPRIVEHMKQTGEWGEFFPASMSPFGYNETVATEYFPLSRETVLGKGKQNSGTFEHGVSFSWSDYEAPFPKVAKVIPASKLPSDISKVPDDIINWAVECEVTNRPFRIIKQELEFYRKHWLPIPHRHPDQRHLDRMKLRNPK